MSEMHPFGSGSHAPLDDPGEMPPCYPIKGNDDSMMFHRPDSRSYDATVAEVWFVSPSVAEAAGFRLADSHPTDVSSADFEPGQAGHPCTVADLTEMSIAAIAHPYGTGSHAPLRDPREMPDCYFIKGNVDSMLYHRPDSANYGATVAEVWFVSPSIAEAAGFGLSSTHPAGSSSAGFEPGGSQNPCTSTQLESMGLGLLAQPYGLGSHAPLADAREMPACYPIKGNVDSMLYHRPDSANYGATVAEVWFVSPSAAEAAGFSLASTHPSGSTSADFEPGADGHACTTNDLVSMGLGPMVHPFGQLSRAPLSNLRDMPACYPIKGNVDSMLYHRPDSANYGATVAEVWFVSPSAAEAAGFALSSTHPQDASSADFELGGSGHPCSAQQFGEIVKASAAQSASARVAAAAAAAEEAASNDDAAVRDTTVMAAADLSATSDDHGNDGGYIGKTAAMAAAGAGVAGVAAVAGLATDDEDKAAADKAAAGAAAEKAAADKAAAEKAAAGKAAAGAAAEKAAADKAAAEKAAAGKAAAGAAAGKAAADKAAAGAAADKAEAGKAAAGVGAAAGVVGLAGFVGGDDETVAGEGAAAIRETAAMAKAEADADMDQTVRMAKPAAAAQDEQPYGLGSHAPLADVHEMPACHPVKGNADSMKYHRPDSQGYPNTKAEVWFVSPSVAEAAGFVLAGSHPEGSSSADFEPGGSGHPCTAEQLDGLGLGALGLVGGGAALAGAATLDADDTVKIESAAPAGELAEIEDEGISGKTVAGAALAGAGVAGAASLLGRDDDDVTMPAAATPDADTRKTQRDVGADVRETLDEREGIGGKTAAAAAAAGAAGIAGAAALSGRGDEAAAAADVGAAAAAADGDNGRKVAGAGVGAAAAGAAGTVGASRLAAGRGGGGDDDDRKVAAAAGGGFGWLKWLLPLLLLLALLALLLWACSGSDDGGGETAGVIGDPDPTEVPTVEATVAPTAEPTAEPAPDPTPEPAPDPTPEPTEEPTPEPTEEPTPEPTAEAAPSCAALVPVLEEGGYSSLLGLVTAADLGGALTDSGPLTVFAPTDEAIAAVPADISAALLADADLLRTVLTYHVVPGAVTSADLSATSVATLNGSSLAVRTDGAAPTINASGFTENDVAADECVVHGVDSVLIPPSLLTTLGVASLNDAVGGDAIMFVDGSADFTNADSATLAAICNLVATEDSTDGLPPVQWQQSGDADIDAARAAAIEDASASCGPGGLGTDALAATPSFTG